MAVQRAGASVNTVVVEEDAMAMAIEGEEVLERAVGALSQRFPHRCSRLEQVCRQEVDLRPRTPGLLRLRCLEGFDGLAKLRFGVGKITHW